jgi:microcystin degradation protein MlrC
MRLAALGLLHETNTFSPNPTGIEQFPLMPVGADQSSIVGIITGQQLWNVHAGAKTTLAGYHAADSLAGVDVVPLVFATSPPAGTITAEAFEAIWGHMARALDQQGPFDGVLMAQHGASVAEGFLDADAEMIRRVRAAVGPRVPIGVVHDTHGNISPAQLEPATVTLLWQTNPHVDCRERGLRTAELIAQTVRGEIRPVQAIEKPPLALNILVQGTSMEPMRTFLAAARALEEELGILSAGIGEGFPYADVPHLGMAFVAISDGDEAKARAGARRLADLAWELRAQCDAQATPPDQAIREALARPDPRPVVLLDVGDNVGAGTPGDATVLLEALLRNRVRSFLVSLFDPAAVRASAAAGQGAHVDLSVGGKTDRLHGDPVRISGTVRSIADNQWEDRKASGGWVAFDAGPSTLIDLDDGGSVLLTTNAVPAAGAGQYAANGVDAASYRIITSKAVYSTRDGYPMAQGFIEVDTPGLAASNLAHFDYRHRPRPLFPLEPNAAYPAAGRTP